MSKPVRTSELPLEEDKGHQEWLAWDPLLGEGVG